MGEMTPAVLLEMTSMWRETLSWMPDAGQQMQFERLYQLIVEGNRQFNLTRITEPDDFWEKHLWDSLRGVMPVLGVNSSFKVIDIGTGAGFPGVPVAIAKPDWHLTLLDSTRKKIAFLNTLLGELNLENAIALTGRAEEIGKQFQHRRAYDLALIRAVAPAPICAEYTLPLLKIDGKAVLYRGHWTDEEASALNVAAEKLGGEIESVEEFTTPVSQSVRHCVYLRKVTATPASSPRLAGVPTQ